MIRAIELGLWLALVAGLSVLAWAGLESYAAPRPTAPVEVNARRTEPRSIADSVSRAVVARDLFRLDRRPSAVPYDPVRGQAGANASAMTPQRPQLHLRGLLVTDTARALIEGFPGIEGGRVVRTGDVIAGLRVVAVSATQVRVAGMDTTWILSLEKSGP